MITHEFHLHKEPFELVRQGLKTIEARLYDERRQQIDIGDEIIFTNRANNDTIRVSVHKLHRAPTFHQLFMDVDPVAFGGTTVEESAKAMEQYYDYNQQQQWGVVGIEFVVK